eukprot:62716-Prymnesium_polylepis.1
MTAKATDTGEPPSAEETAANMPKTITELYAVASSAMLDRLEMKARGGESTQSTAHLRELIEAIFFQVRRRRRRAQESVHPGGEWRA